MICATPSVCRFWTIRALPFTPKSREPRLTPQRYSKLPEPSKPKPAQARAQARQCPNCAGYVPAGMSLCGSCGLDLDTGMVVPLEEEDPLIDAPYVRSGGGIPFGVVMIGGASLLASAVLALFAFKVGSLGAVFLGLVCLFGVYASVQFLRGRSFKLLLVALSIGAAIDVVALVVMPVVRASVDVEEIPVDPTLKSPESTEDEPKAEVEFKPMEERLQESGGLNELYLGLGILSAYAVIAFVMLTPGFRRQYDSF